MQLDPKYLTAQNAENTISLDPNDFISPEDMGRIQLSKEEVLRIQPFRRVRILNLFIQLSGCFICMAMSAFAEEMSDNARTCWFYLFLVLLVFFLVRFIYLRYSPMSYRAAAYGTVFRHEEYAMPLIPWINKNGWTPIVIIHKRIVVQHAQTGKLVRFVKCSVSEKEYHRGDRVLLVYYRKNKLIAYHCNL